MCVCVCACVCVCVRVRVYVIDGRVCFKSLRTVVVGGCEFIFGYKPLARFQMCIFHRCVVAS